MGGVKTLSAKTGFSTFRLFMDYLGAVILHGTLIRQYTIGGFWRKSNMERKRCLTYPRMVKWMNKYNDKASIPYLNEKEKFNAFFKDFVQRDWLYVRDSEEADFTTFIRQHDTVIIKPVAGVEGGGIRKFVLSKQPDTNLGQLYKDLQSEDVLLEECIVQHPRMVFGNTSVNTIRTMTVLDKHGRGHVVKAILRVGVGDSVVDNYCQGGSIYEVDVTTGIVNSYGKSKAGDLHIRHPRTDIVMLGYQIPNWDKVIALSERAAEFLPQIRIIGWDVAITKDGAQMIEGNHNPDYELYEFIGSSGYHKIFKMLLGNP